jgi:sodium/potassium/calcium exchanger 6
LILPDHHDPANQHLGHIHHQHPDQAPSVVQRPLTKIQKFRDFVKALKPIYFPTLLDWNRKSAFVKFLAITSIPMVLVLTLTLPVVERCDDDEEFMDDESMDGASDPSRPKITIDYGTEKEILYDSWSRTATTTQMVAAPIFVATVVTSTSLSTRIRLGKMDDDCLQCDLTINVYSRCRGRRIHCDSCGMCCRTGAVVPGQTL